MFINPLPNPKIPPYSFFEPIGIEPKDWMTSTEFLLGMLKKLNETILQVNKNTEFIDEYNGKIEEIETAITNLQQEMVNFENQVTDEMNRKFIEIRVELESLIATALTQANAYTDAIASQLRQEIEDISVGDITVYDPSTGLLSPLQTVLDNIYGAGREDALTATEYDALDLSATDYDAYDLTAFNYDKYGKTLLV